MPKLKFKLTTNVFILHRGKSIDLGVFNLKDRSIMVMNVLFTAEVEFKPLIYEGQKEQ